MLIRHTHCWQSLFEDVVNIKRYRDVFFVLILLIVVMTLEVFNTGQPADQLRWLMDQDREVLRADPVLFFLVFND